MDEEGRVLFVFGEECNFEVTMSISCFIEHMLVKGSEPKPPTPI